MAVGASNTVHGANSMAIGSSNYTAPPTWAWPQVAVNECIAIGFKNATGDGIRNISIGIENTSLNSSSNLYNYLNGGGAIAIGYINKASGRSAIAIGYDNTVEIPASTFVSSLAIGIKNKVTNNFSLAVGSENITNGEYSSAIGYKNVASQATSSAVGFTNEANGNSSSALGYDNTASGHYSLAVGFMNVTAKYDTSAVGFKNTASGIQSLAVGFMNYANDRFAVALGWNNNRDVRAATKYAANSALDPLIILNDDGTLGIIMQAGVASAAIGYNNKSLANNSTALGVNNVVLNPLSISAQIHTAGTGYAVNDIITLVGGTGTAATFTVTAVIDSAVTALSDLNNGGAYIVIPYILSNISTTTNQVGTGLTLNVSRNYTSSIASAQIEQGGSGYVVGNIIALVGGTGTAAKFSVITVSAGVVTAIQLNTAGDYTSIPQLSDTSTTVAMPSSTLQLTLTRRYSVNSRFVGVYSGGTGYAVNDIITLVGGTGTAATFKVTTVSDGVVLTITAINAGGQYSVIPRLNDGYSQTAAVNINTTATKPNGTSTLASGLLISIDPSYITLITAGSIHEGGQGYLVGHIITVQDPYELVIAATFQVATVSAGVVTGVTFRTSTDYTYVVDAVYSANVTAVVQASGLTLNATVVASSATTSFGASAIGSYNSCIGQRSLAIGYQNTIQTAVGYSNAIGLLNTVSDYYATAVGMRNTVAVNSNSSIAIGNDVTVGSNYTNRAVTGVMELGYQTLPAITRSLAVTATINNAGTGYSSGNSITVVGGTGTAATYTVTAVSGAVTVLTATNFGGAYVTLPTTLSAAATATTGSGIGLTLDLITTTTLGASSIITGAAMLRTRNTSLRIAKDSFVSWTVRSTVPSLPMASTTNRTLTGVVASASTLFTATTPINSADNLLKLIIPGSVISGEGIAAGTTVLSVGVTNSSPATYNPNVLILSAPHNGITNSPYTFTLPAEPGEEIASQLPSSNLMYYTRIINGIPSLTVCYNYNNVLYYKDLGAMSTTAP